MVHPLKVSDFKKTTLEEFEDFSSKTAKNLAGSLNTPSKKCN
ncbi:hypothetical protein LEP1GSC050_2678 [Leptospira broomii serovar Hurstbridge str. 5399]|uniref:Uncharacterized protein n=1 Tax=Leptospira broomii serovar Hurstbridge str. 5399 TaxID=1049789 RepID=T0FEK3_9LEPT|nr:hypothetical protein LEP1GSC050_2678 [Leptospira broomii serovar Hurstbridge str. 5399]